ncbi:MAG: long-chain fatty acid--CoA ligase [Candidatus Rokubacteria bacterium]|nr:long-chain fatty acid--CoA ligase [Candidatus Rokubacteria bacterium]
MDHAANPVVPAPAGTRATRRPWHRAWPRHLPFSLDYPDVPAWWILERNLERFADRVALRTLDHETGSELGALTYAGLWSSATAVAAGFARLGVGKGDRVALCLANGPELAASFYATWLLGATVVPLNPALTERELSWHAADAAPRLLVAGSSGAAVAAAVASRLGVTLVIAGGTEGPGPAGSLHFEELRREDGRGVSPARVNPGEDVAVLLYTGGSTGAPKGAMLTHRNLVANTIQFAEWYAFEPGAETCIGALPMFHSGGMSGVMNVPLYAGATILVFRRFNPATVARAVERFRATRLFGVPTMFIALLNHEAGRRADYSSLRACRTNAAPLPASVKAAFDELVGREVLIEGYGLTETSPLTHANPLHRARPGSIGIPLPDTDAKVVDLETGADLPAGEAGELVIRGPPVMKAYWNRPAETAQAFAGGWFHTGDVARMDADGYFVIVDRKKDQINTAGFKVWPREVEEVLYGHPAVRMVAVIGQPDAYRGEVVKAFVVLKEAYRGRVDEGALVAFCKAQLTGYKVPRVVEFRDELPVSATGKTLRRALRAHER